MSSCSAVFYIRKNMPLFNPSIPYVILILKYVTFVACVYTSAVLRMECSIDCINGSVGHQQNMFRSFAHRQRFF